MKIIITTIPHETQRYPTVGDWAYDFTHTCKWCGVTLVSPSRDEEVCPKCSQPMDYEERLHIKVSQMPDQRMVALVAVHELVEALLCKEAGVTTDIVDAFDMEFEKKRKEGQTHPEAEPGDDSAAPYQRQHGFATAVERMMAAEMNVPWENYAVTIEALG